MNEQIQPGTSALDQLLDEIDPLEMNRTRLRMAIAANLDDLLRQRKYSKQHFASLVKQQPSVVSKWLGGRHNFTGDTLADISFVLGVSLAELVSEPQPKTIARSTAVVTSAGVLAQAEPAACRVVEYYYSPFGLEGSYSRDPGRFAGPCVKSDELSISLEKMRQYLTGVQTVLTIHNHSKEGHIYYASHDQKI